MRWQALVIATFVLALSGCSGMSVLMVRNLTGSDLMITMASDRPHHGEGYEKQHAAGSEIETLHWFSYAPDWIEVTIEEPDGSMRKNKWQRRDYPPMMQKGSSSPTYYVLEIRATEMLLRDPSGWDAVRRNPLGYGLLVAVPAGVAFAVVMAVRRSLLNRRGVC